jgi:ABC-2 type transport system ATP-binding protein
MIEVSNVSVSGPAEKGRLRATLRGVSLTSGPGILALLGASYDGTSLLLDVVDGTARPKTGRVTVFGANPADARSRIARVADLGFLPEALRVEEACALSSELRGEPPTPPRERLDRLGLGALASRVVRTLTIPERRSVALAIALASRADVLLVDEPLVAVDPVAPRLLVDALREKGKTACVIVTTASARDAAALGARVGVLTAGVYAPLSTELLHGDAKGASMRVVVPASGGKAGGAALLAALSTDEAVARADSAAYPAAEPASAAVVLAVYGRSLSALAHAVTRAVASTGVDVELVEAATQPLDKIRAALASRPGAPS